MSCTFGPSVYLSQNSSLSPVLLSASISAYTRSKSSISRPTCLFSICGRPLPRSTGRRRHSPGHRHHKKSAVCDRVPSLSGGIQTSNGCTPVFSVLAVRLCRRSLYSVAQTLQWMISSPSPTAPTSCHLVYLDGTHKDTGVLVKDHKYAGSSVSQSYGKARLFGYNESKRRANEGLPMSALDRESLHMRKALDIGTTMHVRVCWRLPRAEFQPIYAIMLEGALTYRTGAATMRTNHHQTASAIQLYLDGRPDYTISGLNDASRLIQGCNPFFLRICCVDKDVCTAGGVTTKPRQLVVGQRSVLVCIPCWIKTQTCGVSHQYDNVFRNPGTDRHVNCSSKDNKHACFMPFTEAEFELNLHKLTMNNGVIETRSRLHEMVCPYCGGGFYNHVSNRRAYRSWRVRIRSKRTYAKRASSSSAAHLLSEWTRRPRRRSYVIKCTKSRRPASVAFHSVPKPLAAELSSVLTSRQSTGANAVVQHGAT